MIEDRTLTVTRELKAAGCNRIFEIKLHPPSNPDVLSRKVSRRSGKSDGHRGAAPDSLFNCSNAARDGGGAGLSAHPGYHDEFAQPGTRSPKDVRATLRSYTSSSGRPRC